MGGRGDAHPDGFVGLHRHDRRGPDGAGNHAGEDHGLGRPGEGRQQGPRGSRPTFTDPPRIRNVLRLIEAGEPTTQVTGGDSGIGRAAAIADAREGADVLVAYLEEDDDAQDTARWIEEAGRRAVLVRGDLSDPARCRAVVEKAVQEFGRIDVLVSNAAYRMSHDSLEKISDEEWDYTFRLDVGAMFHLAQAAVPHMAPGPIWTPLIPATMPPEKVGAFGDDVPLGRGGRPAELAAVYVLLASDDGSYISGSRVAVTGGKPVL